MSARSTSPTSKGSNNNHTFALQNDAATYRDLLLFEERLKSNAANLQQRKAKYQLFLVNLVLVIVLLLAEVLFLSPDSSLLVIPYRYVAQRLLPQTYADRDVTLHSYIAQGLLFVSVTSLVLFFASGMYGEKIGYANK
ncbi:hypothetical protein FISHEDRAFT_40700 [Fistulina hepatica ATCC 64428]|uniref:Transmembrane protein 188 n=1 Tax=Fistulina hepatica ATCC 64428 TaxID=1128425 RepID=A0A0D7AH85_9AGAR|nr:hypothetical protein FISHEDRAFT_40700 [Fistulina hepatica ATCC 64428]